ncbi:MAG: isochorismatase family protein [Terrimicrobiaceae bacterium]
MKHALLIIDVQQALCSGAEAAFDIDRVVDRINSVSTKARVAGGVSHPARGNRGIFSTAQEAGDSTIALLVHPEDIRVRKNTPDSFHKTELQSLLQARNVETLVVCGLQSDFCVDCTVRRALALGYQVVLVSVADSTVDNGVLSAAEISAHHNTTLANIGSFGPRVTLTKAAEVRFEA